MKTEKKIFAKEKIIVQKQKAKKCKKENETVKVNFFLDEQIFFFSYLLLLKNLLLDFFLH